MKVNDRHLAVMRAVLWGQEATLERWAPAVQREGAESEHVLELLLKMTFSRAIRKRFGPEATAGDLIRYVARARTTGFLRHERLDIRIVERLLRGALGDDEAARGMTAEDTSMLGPILVDLVHNELDLDEAGVNVLLDEAREQTDYLATQLSS